ncbi:hypothetical protein [Chitinophaga tropicalis]|uniref:Uncharacterized protein n=1 Tax=Chitinophaga tropicalis TaxID=2683588 RepID=A0A7K1TZZ5_9BACT|nr:hypothetical protein [Chitinophaga tropicalis]MVT07691.1 hypothetical protein [Chitinophaga tropicalis]
MARESSAERERREAALRKIAGPDGDHQWMRLEADMKKIGLVHLTEAFLRESFGRDQSLLLRPWHQMKDGSAILIFDVRRHAHTHQYYLHGYEAAMTTLVAASYKYLDVRQLSASQHFLASQGPLPKPRHAIQQLKTMLLEKRKQLGVGYKIRHPGKNRGRSL